MTDINAAEKELEELYYAYLTGEGVNKTVDEQVEDIVKIAEDYWYQVAVWRI